MFTYVAMEIEHYDGSIALWKETEGLALSEADSRSNIERYLARNPRMSFVCLDGEQVIGTILGGHDGRRGYIYHMAVHPNHRGQAIGRQLAALSLKRMRGEGIVKCHIMVIAGNELGNRFWAKIGWQRRDGILLFSSDTLEGSESWTKL